MFDQLDLLELTKIELPNTLQIIREETFRLCQGVTLLKLPKAVFLVQQYAFYGCFTLTIMVRMKKPLFSAHPKFFSKDWKDQNKHSGKVCEFSRLVYIG